jgi:hypothetical protein
MLPLDHRRASPLLLLLLLLLCGRGSMASLPRTSAAPASPPAAAVVFLHGLGDTPAGWKSIVPQMGARLEKVVGGRVKVRRILWTYLDF